MRERPRKAEVEAERRTRRAERRESAADTHDGATQRPWDESSRRRRRMPRERDIAESEWAQVVCCSFF